MCLLFNNENVHIKLKMRMIILLFRVKLWGVTSGSIVPAVRHQSVPTLRQEDGAEVAREAMEMEERGQGNKMNCL